jgi:peptidoglycan-N-acetylglucosamine deacetylase
VTRIRIATVIAILAAGMFLLGCGRYAGSEATWNAAPAASDTSGMGGGGAYVEATSALEGPKPTGSVQKTTNGSTVALTFDDGPDPKNTPAMLALLRKHQVKATFCLVGSNAQQFPDLVRAIVADGHTLCNHTWKHDLQLGKRDEATIRSDLKRTNDAITAAVPGAKVTQFRHPGGMWTPAAVKIATEMGMACAGWDVDTDDWNTSKWAAGDPMKQHVLSVLRTQVKAGSIVLAHDAGGDRRGTLAAYEEALPELKSKFTLAPLS